MTSAALTTAQRVKRGSKRAGLMLGSIALTAGLVLSFIHAADNYRIYSKFHEQAACLSSNRNDSLFVEPNTTPSKYLYI